MQEIKKRRIVIASILKPVDDTRMFEKIGVSLSDLYDVHIIGLDAGSVVSSGKPSVTFHSLGIFERLSFDRIIAPFRILKLVISLKPDVFILTTHELLAIAVMAKLLTGCKVMYDVQENHARNIYYGDSFPWLMRLPLSVYVRIKEWIFSPFVSHYLLAERNYARELGFVGKAHTILENKLKLVPPPSAFRNRSDKSKIRLLFSGTMATTTGVFTAIELATTLHKQDPRIELCIIGYAGHADMRHRVRQATAGKLFIEVIGLDYLVPHAIILRQIANADFGIIAYPPNPSTQMAFPTKLYEYMGHQLPILLAHNTVWLEYCAPYVAALEFDPHKLVATDLLNKMMSTSFYTTLPEGVFWSDEEQRLRLAVQ